MPLRTYCVRVGTAGLTLKAAHASSNGNASKTMLLLGARARLDLCTCPGGVHSADAGADTGQFWW